MTPRRDRNERQSKAAKLFEANRAAHQAEMKRGMAARQRTIEAMERRVADFRRAREQASEAIERRVAELMAGKGRRRPPEGRRRRDEEGGEPVPVVPKRGPNPLAGAAAAPIE
jgi:hypothetical protein